MQHLYVHGTDATTNLFGRLAWVTRYCISLFETIFGFLNASHTSFNRSLTLLLRRGVSSNSKDFLLKRFHR